MFRKDDWTQFRNLTTLQQKSGVPTSQLLRLALKELADNALDAAGDADAGRTEDGLGYFVEDHGLGLSADPAVIQELFSIRRGLVSTKHLRLPTRGALGNGLRVVTGAMLASGGYLVVIIRGHRFVVRPQDTGDTEIEMSVASEHQAGTRIELYPGPSLLDISQSPLLWARQAIRFSQFAGEAFKGRSSPWWYDSDSFYELLQGAGERSVREFIVNFEGLSGGKSGTVAKPYQGRACVSLDRDDAENLLLATRGQSSRVTPRRLGGVGQLPDWTGYAREEGTFPISPGRGKAAGEVPFVVEVWGRPAEKDMIQVYANHTPIVHPISIQRQKASRTCVGLFNCGLHHSFEVGTKPVSLMLHILSPHIPITSDGKQPDLSVFRETMFDAVEKAARRAKRNGGGGAIRQTIKSVVLEHLDEAIAKASGGGQFRYSIRQLFYAVRPYLIEAFGDDPNYGTFEGIIKDYEGELGQDLPGIYRDNRGTLYHPHLKETIPLGTLSVEGYERPAWTFNKVLYCEKEGFFETLRAIQWPERHDCALLTSKGYASKAARDLLDLLGESDEEVQFFAVHDADGYGTKIYESLVEATRARPGLKVRVENLGLEPEEAVAMGLPIEMPERKSNRAIAVADYVQEPWREWLQTRRVELNAMTTPQFIEWLDRKFAPFESGKLVPPSDVIHAELVERVQEQLEDEVKGILLQRADYKGAIGRAIQAVEPHMAETGAEIGIPAGTTLSVSRVDPRRKHKRTHRGLQKKTSVP